VEIVSSNNFFAVLVLEVLTIIGTCGDSRCLPQRKVRRTISVLSKQLKLPVERGNNAGPYHSVLVTPLGAYNTLSPVLPASSTARHGVLNPHIVEPWSRIIEKMILKATVKEGKEFKLFILSVKR